MELTKYEFEKWLEKQYPFEACGICSGIYFYPIRTVGSYNDNFIIRADSLATTLDIIDDTSNITFIHSHIDSEPIASKTDKLMMKNWNINHIIYSIYRGKIRDRKSYRKAV